MVRDISPTIRFSISQKAITNQALDPILWDPTSILEDNKLLGVLGIQGWVVGIHEKLQLDPPRLVCIIHINLVHLLHLGNKRNGGFLPTEGDKAAADFESLLMSIVWIEILQ
jgi:hypothetical protein